MEFFLRKGCGCAHGDKENPCSSTIPLKDVVDCRNNCAELFSTELDLVILGTIHSSINCDEVSHSRRTEKICQQTRIPFFFSRKANLFENFPFYASLNIIGRMDYRLAFMETRDVCPARLSVLKQLSAS